MRSLTEVLSLSLTGRSVSRGDRKIQLSKDVLVFFKNANVNFPI